MSHHFREVGDLNLKRLRRVLFKNKTLRTHKEKFKVEIRKMSEKFEELNLPNAVIKRIIKEKIPSG